MDGNEKRNFHSATKLIQSFGWHHGIEEISLLNEYS